MSTATEKLICPHCGKPTLNEETLKEMAKGSIALVTDCELDWARKSGLRVETRQRGLLIRRPGVLKSYSEDYVIIEEFRLHRGANEFYAEPATS
jgi:hypothetical protein